MKNTRRRFLQSVSLTATGMALLPSPVGANKKIARRTSDISCAPQQEFSLTGTVSSVKTGKWSDPTTWGGKVPAAGDTPLIAAGHTVTFDVAQATVAGLNVNSGGVLAFDANQSTTLLTTANVVIQGRLQMRPSSVSVIQAIRFTAIDETRFVGGGMDVLATDIGIWVMGAGVLELIGTPKTSWTRSTGAIASGSTTVTVEGAGGWQVGDEISITPTEAPTVGAAFSSGFEERTIKAISGNTITLSSGATRPHPMVNGMWAAEVVNLTRNVIIEGTANGKGHIFIRSTQPQTLKHITIRNFGARRDRGGSSAKELVAGRYSLHFHHCMDGARGSLVEGCVVRDGGNHSYVPHVSHGIKFIDNVAYNVLETAFWWDPGDPTHDVIYDHNIVALARWVSGSLNMNAEDAPTFSSSGFGLNTGDGNVCKNNVVVAGGQGDHADGGAYNWEAVINEGVWIFTGNMAHNSDCGLRVWQNSTRNHVVEDFICYHNQWGMFHGAYANSYTYTGGYFYGNGIEVKAASVNTNRVRLENITIDGAGIVDYGVQVIHSPLPGDKPVFMRNLTIRNCKVAAVFDSAAPEVHSTDLVQCTISGALTVASGAADGETIRVQPKSGQSYQITKSGTSNIAPFAPSVWGTGKGLKGEYFNSNNFTNPAMTRIDSNVSFTEWSAGVHYAITGSTYSARWTGKIMPQYSEAFTFYLGSGGGHRLWIDNKIIIDSWVEHYPDQFKSVPVTLVAGQLYDLKLEYFNNDGGTGMGLLWSSPSLPIEYVPQSQLFAEAIIVQPNKGPVANAGADIVLNLPTSSTNLNGSASYDPDGTISAYQWTKLSGPAQFTIASPKTATSALTGLAAGTYVFRLQVTDNKGATNEDDVTVTVNAAANTAPVANAGTDIVLMLPTNSTTLNGTASKDTDGSIATYLWTKVSGPTQFTITNPSSATTALTSLAAGSYVFRLKVTDDKGASHEDDVTVTVNAAGNQSPVANAGTDIVITLPTSSTTLNGSASKDPDGNLVAYAWTKISGPTQFTIASPAAVTTALNNLVAGVYVFRLKVTDDKGGIHEDDVTVTVNAAGNQTPLANAGADIVITLPTSSTTLNGTLSKDPDGSLVTYAWSKISGPTQFTIASPAAVTTALTNLVAGVYVFRLKVTDNKGATHEDDVTVTVNAAGNQSPVANAGPDVVIMLPANSTTLNGSASKDPDGSITAYAWTKISGPSQFTIASPSAATTALNNLVAGTYVFRLKVTDNKGATHEDDVTVTVNAAGNQPPVANAGSDIVISLPVNVTVLNGSASKDPDGSIVSYTWTKVSGPSAFAINNPNAVSPVISSLAVGVYVLRLQVKDNAGATAEDDVTVTVKAQPTEGGTSLVVKVAPNPSTTTFTIQITTNVNYPITVGFYNASGVLVDKVVRTGLSTTISIGTSWPKGTYYVVVEQGSVRRLVTLLKM
ncbi:PA14 domain-containing protein [Paraflavitalea sp. CAU 1676]|uniref:PKD domain-containing protein n=1 Tax=Paraflavitalea sp. CAU 1676 TaxID=3032598 RepID=UPI0023DC9DD3|nr:PA14 domain-containing protein [Paraflavitalea sp. CAU 1676]MDF2189677.1 PA14 domain-containing protein [Paraflavitalea sp. CAU 1676]